MDGNTTICLLRLSEGGTLAFEDIWIAARRHAADIFERQSNTAFVNQILDICRADGAQDVNVFVT